MRQRLPAPPSGAASVPGRLAAAFAAAVALLFTLGAPSVVAAEPGEHAKASRSAGVDAGKRLYRDGVLASGERLQATVQNDVPIDGAQLSCAYCHRHSGLGTSEGGNVVPALTAASLYQPREKVLRQAYRSKAGTGEERPAYTDESLAVAIRGGVDPGGRVLDRLMPRYQIDDESMASLIAHLKTLSAEDAPGVTESTLHIATIVTDGVADDDRKAMLAILEGYVEVKNRETRNEVRNSRYATFYRDQVQQAYRKWELHVWDLSGPEETWGEQLSGRYAEQPVFAVINGIAAGRWEPIHEFCVKTEIPCLFPHTDLPFTSQQDFYALYMSRGLDLEARALARHLQQLDLPSDARIVQIWQRGGAGETPARVLREALEAAGRASVEDHVVRTGEALQEAELRSALLGERRGERGDGSGQGEPATVLVLWLPEPNLDRLALVAGEAKELDHVYLSSSLSGQGTDVPAALGRRLNLVHPFDVPRNEPRNLTRMNNWLNSRGIARGDPRTQADAYFAVTFFARAMKHISQNYSREYLIEVLEHALDNATFNSVYPRVSLGPGQRFASKGAYILGLSSDAEPEWQPVSDWIIP